jgi:dienelactone hydrolase
MQGFAPRTIVAAILAAAWSVSAFAETVQFPGQGVTLTGELLRPAGPGPFPAVVALHGCGGLGGKTSVLNARHRDWGERLQRQGFVVLFPDSFGSRGVGSQCRSDERVARATRERVEDAVAAKDYLRSRPDVKPSAITLLGWSNGGSTVLNALKAGSASGFARAVAMYPGCTRVAADAGWHTRTPLMVLIGEADDWTPAAPCQALAARAQAAGEPVSIKVYTGAYHDFDHPNSKVHLNTGLAYTAGGDGAAHSGTDPAARADAIERVDAFLAR